MLLRWTLAELEICLIVACYVLANRNIETEFKSTFEKMQLGRFGERWG